MFHGITDIYVESDEEDNILEPEENDKSQDQEEYLNWIRVMIVEPNHCPLLEDHPPRYLNIIKCAWQQRRPRHFMNALIKTK